MKAAYIRTTGSPDVIQYGDIPDPTLGTGQVLVKMSAVSVNPIDTYIRNGANYWPLPDPFVIGCDLAGTVVAVDSNVKKSASWPARLVQQSRFDGTAGLFFRTVRCRCSLALPNSRKGLGPRCSGLRARRYHFASRPVSRRQTAARRNNFVRGGVGGIGSMVLQMAKTIGAKVITTAGSAEKAYRCQQFGADVVIDYTKEDVGQRIKAAAPQGVNVFWETLREPDFNWPSIRWPSADA